MNPIPNDPTQPASRVLQIFIEAWELHHRWIQRDQEGVPTGASPKAIHEKLLLHHKNLKETIQDLPQGEQKTLTREMLAWSQANINEILEQIQIQKDL